MNSALINIGLLYLELKNREISSLDDYLITSNEIQKLSALLHYQLLPLALKNNDFAKFYKNYVDLVLLAKKAKEDKLSFNLDAETVTIFRDGKEESRFKTLSPEKLKNLYYNGNEELDLLVELFFCNQYVFGLINFLSYIQ